MHFFKGKGRPLYGPHTAQLPVSFCAPVMNWGTERPLAFGGRWGDNIAPCPAAAPTAVTWAQPPCVILSRSSPAFPSFESTECLSTTWPEFVAQLQVFICECIWGTSHKTWLWRLTNNANHTLLKRQWPKGLKATNTTIIFVKGKERKEEHCSLVTSPCLKFLPAC